jgi:hypothetical protein
MAYAEGERALASVITSKAANGYPSHDLAPLCTPTAHLEKMGVAPRHRFSRDRIIRPKTILFGQPGADAEMAGKRAPQNAISDRVFGQGQKRSSQPAQVVGSSSAKRNAHTFAASKVL